jgi:hypothetical protein
MNITTFGRLTLVKTAGAVPRNSRRFNTASEFIRWRHFGDNGRVTSQIRVLLFLFSLAVARAQLSPAVEARIDTLLMNDQRALPLERGR